MIRILKYVLYVLAAIFGCLFAIGLTIYEWHIRSEREDLLVMKDWFAERGRQGGHWKNCVRIAVPLRVQCGADTVCKAKVSNWFADPCYHGNYEALVRRDKVDLRRLTPASAFNEANNPLAMASEKEKHAALIEFARATCQRELASLPAEECSNEIVDFVENRHDGFGAGP